jgi:hypothetical protein
VRLNHALSSLALTVFFTAPLTLVACSSDPEPGVDAAVAADATGLDATAANPDATTFPDAAAADAAAADATVDDAMPAPDAAGPADSGEADAGVVAMDAMAAPDAMPAMDAGAPAPDWATVYRGVISRGCGCHINGSREGGLAFPNARAAIADVRAALVRAGNANCGGAATNVVTVGDANASMLYLKVAGTTCGTRMPRGGAPLAQTDIDLIRDWIAGGAN